VGERELWLVPKRKPGTAFDEALLSYSNGILWDTYSEKLYGGTGRTGDWEGFQKLSARHTDRKWMLSGGLNPENLDEAAKRSGSTIFDINSGVESSPGIKDPARIQAVRRVLLEL